MNRRPGRTRTRLSRTRAICENPRSEAPIAHEHPSTAIRDARAGDAEAICLIYNQGIQDRLATLETEPRTPAERGLWLSARGPRHPVIVAEADGRVVGWGSLNSFNPRPVYDHVADFSVYVERGWRGKGVGRALLDALCHKARSLDYHKLVLAAFPFNEAGLRLYERSGFRQVGVYKEQGRVDGRWVDIVLMEKLL
jgi:L-amino acid N-acyltransferase YncA